MKPVSIMHHKSLWTYVTHCNTLWTLIMHQMWVWLWLGLTLTLITQHYRCIIGMLIMHYGLSNWEPLLQRNSADSWLKLTDCFYQQRLLFSLFPSKMFLFLCSWERKRVNPGDAGKNIKDSCFPLSFILHVVLFSLTEALSQWESRLDMTDGARKITPSDRQMLWLSVTVKKRWVRRNDF